MAATLRPRAIPQCTACLRSYAFGAYRDSIALRGASYEQIRGKKRTPKGTDTVSVRLLRDVRKFGRAGAIVPVAKGRMRNLWYPRRTADYVTMPELKTLRANNVPIERDFNFGITQVAEEEADERVEDDAIENPVGSPDRAAPSSSSSGTSERARREKTAAVQQIHPERATELVEIFVPKRLYFTRPAIVEENEPETSEPESKPSRAASGIASELLTARTAAPSAPQKPKPKGRQAIYGSVSTQDVLLAIRATMGGNDEAKLVVVQDDDLHFIDLPVLEGAESGRVKHLGDFKIEIRVKGAGRAVHKTVRVLPQQSLG